jgi:hypothetical protein
LRNKRKPSTEDGIPVVTYSRLPADREPPEAGPHALRDAEPWLNGVEVPLVERQGRPRVAPDIRADARTEAYDDPPVAPAAADPFEPQRRRPRRLLTTVAAVALVALVAGFGILALTFHAATTVTVQAPALARDPQAEIADLQKQIDQLANTSGPASEATRAKIAELEARLADVEAAKAPPASAAPAVRTIPTAATADAAPAADVAPPAPRERPATKEARAVPDAAEKPAPAAKLVVPVTAVPETPAPRVEPKVAALPTGRAKAGDAAPAGDADFIARVEKALADAPPDPKRTVSAVPPRAAPLAPAGAFAPSGALAPADEEPAGVASPAGAPAAFPSDIGPAVRVIPPAGGASADARPILLAPRAAPPAAATPAPMVLDVPPEPGTPVPPEPIPNH